MIGKAHKSKSVSQGFTLIELLVVIANTDTKREKFLLAGFSSRRKKFHASL